MSRSEELFARAVKRIPGGVNSPVRAYQSVGMTPRFIQGASGPYVFDVDGRQYINYILSWGPMMQGHNNQEILQAVVRAAENGLSFGAATETEVEMAELLCENIPHLEMVRMVNSGTEAVMSAVRAARGFTGRNKIIKFMGCYHGHSDAMLVKAGSGVMTAGVPDSAGVPEGCTRDTLSAVYNDLDSAAQLFEQFRGEVAAVIVEPVAANMGVVLPKPEFLAGLRKLCDENHALLIFDEVITGFRLAFGGAAEYFGIRPDLVTYGKIIGAGMPVGAYGGRREIMEMIAPSGAVYQAGTLSGNPVAMAAGITQVKYLLEHPEVYEETNGTAEGLFKGMEELIRRYDAPCTLNHVGSLGSIFFTDHPVENYAQAKQSDTAAFAGYFRHMLEGGVHLAPSQFEAIFVSRSHSQETTDRTLEVLESYLKEGRKHG